MASISSAVLDLKKLDLLSHGDSSLHRLDPRSKVVVTLVFIICIVSFGRYELTALFPFFIFPVAMIAISSIPFLFITRKIALLLPFALLAGAFNPLFDRDILLQLGPVAISGGWISFVSILIRSTLTVGIAFVLVGMTGFTAVCQALRRLGMPQVFVVQLLFLYRYIFVLADEVDRAARARELRSCGKRGQGLSSFGSLTGHLLLRTCQRAERIHMAMLSRGFTGEINVYSASRFGLPELRFVVCWLTLFMFLRLQNVPQLLGTFITGLVP